MKGKKMCFEINKGIKLDLKQTHRQRDKRARKKQCEEIFSICYARLG